MSDKRGLANIFVGDTSVAAGDRSVRPARGVNRAYALPVARTFARLIACLAVIAQASPVAAQSEKLAAEYRQDFRDGHFDARGLNIDGPDGRKDLVVPGRDGLRVTVPPGVDRRVGVSTRFQVRGDFEVTAGFDVPADMRPEAGATADFELHVRPPGEWDNFASMSRSVGPEGAFLSYYRGTFLDGRRGYKGRKVAFGATSGRLRIARAGATLLFSVAEGDGEFRELFQAESWAGDVGQVRLTGGPKMSKAPNQVVWKDLVIRAEALPGWSGGPPRPARVP